MYRDLNIAYANLLALMAEKLGIDIYEAIRLANTHHRVNIHMPGAGVGGTLSNQGSIHASHDTSRVLGY